MHRMRPSGLQVCFWFCKSQYRYLTSCHFVQGHLLTRKAIIEILKEHGVSHKARDKKEILVRIYTRFTESESQAKSLPKSSFPSTAPNNSSEAPVASESNSASLPCEFATYETDELRELLQPVFPKTASLSRKKLLMLCQAYNNRCKWFNFYHPKTVSVH